MQVLQGSRRIREELEDGWLESNSLSLLAFDAIKSIMQSRV